MTKNPTFCYCLIMVRPKREKLIRSIKNALKSKLLVNIVTKSACMAMRLKDKFNIKTKVILLLSITFLHIMNLVS